MNFILHNTVTSDLGKGTGPAGAMLSPDPQQGSCPAAGTGVPRAPREGTDAGRTPGRSSDERICRCIPGPGDSGCGN